MSGVLASILASKKREIKQLEQQTCETRFPWEPRKNVASSLRRRAGEPLRLIAENKKKSPSAGELSSILSTAARVVRYASSGATMVSVLCDEPFFGGSWDDVADARAALARAGYSVPVLAKEYILSERQLFEARACGADAVLLIARILEKDALKQLFTQTTGLGMEAVVEVATEEELEGAVSAGATIIGVNARDLDTLVMDPERASRVLAAIPDTCVPLYLSGLKGPDDVRRIAETRAHGALIGETLMREDDPKDALVAMVRAAACLPPLRSQT
jgi:indole-3-glycerol phosphate synthase